MFIFKSKKIGTTQMPTHQIDPNNVIEQVQTIIDRYRTFVSNLLDMTDLGSSPKRNELLLDLMRAIENDRLDYDKFHNFLTSQYGQIDTFHRMR